MKKTLVTNRTRMPKSSRNNSKRPILFRRLSIFLLICMVAISSFSVSADSLLYESPASNYPAINAIVNKYATSDTVFTVSGHKALKSLSTDEADYTLYSLYPYGFAIFLNETNSMMEACYQENVTLPVSMDSTVAYYGGPMNYYEIVDEKFTNTMNGSVLSDEDVVALRSVESRALSYERTLLEQAITLEAGAVEQSVASVAVTSGQTSIFVAQDYFEGLTAYGVNRDGTCTVIAACILFGYYDNYVHDKYVQSFYESGTGTNDSFHQYMNGLVYGTGDPGGIYIHNAENGFNEHLDNVVATSNFEHFSISIVPHPMTDVILSKLITDKPVIASMATSKGALWNHSVVIYGASYETSNLYSTIMYHFQTGWHENAGPRLYTASAGWFYECGYIACGLQNHDSLDWTFESALTHRGYCDCSGNITEYHNFENTATGARCAGCGYVSNAMINSIGGIAIE